MVRHSLQYIASKQKEDFKKETLVLMNYTLNYGELTNTCCTYLGCSLRGMRY